MVTFGCIFANVALQSSTLVYVEGDARMKSYEDAEGRKQSSLSIVQRKLFLFPFNASLFYDGVLFWVSWTN